jgi:signal transduction histidine kinase
MLTSDLLTLSRLEEPGAEAERHFVRLDLGRLATETTTELRHLAEAKQQTLVVDVAETPRVRGDAVSLQTLIRNLLDNAFRYTEPGGHLSIGVKSEPQTGGTEWVVLTVQDDGVGIPAADQRRIFERFYRVDKGRSRETGGTGLGLSIVRHVAERHGGSVAVSSILGSGSTFTVRLPAAE